MNRFYSAFFLTCVLLLASLSGVAQPGTDPATGCSGCTPSATRSYLKTQWYDGVTRTISSYTTSRLRMYSNIYNYSGVVTCVYTGFTMPSASTSNLDPINCEHTVPQSFFGSSEPARSDIHHLYPTHGSVNSARSNYKVGNVSDSEAESWYTAISNVYTTRSTAPTSNPQTYSKLNSSGSGAPMFEPRDDHKGDIARSIFYFYVCYPTIAGAITGVADPNVLYQWHLQDPVSANEIEKNNRIASFQNTRNFFIDYPGAVLQAWGDLISVAGPTIGISLPKTSFFVGESFTVNYTALGSYTAGNVFTVQLSDAAGSFSSPTTLGSVTRTSGGAITCTIPGSVMTAGSAYAIRVISSTPSVTGTAVGLVTITLTPPPSTLDLVEPAIGSIERGTGFAVNYVTSGVFDPANTFTVYLATSFMAIGDGVIVGTISSTTSGVVNCVIPVGQAPASGYRVRIVASNPELISSQSSAFTVTAPVAPAIDSVRVAQTTLAPGESFEVSYGVSGTFNPGNVYTAELSNAAGSFASPTVIGSGVATTDGEVNCFIPANIPAGAGYRIRVTSSTPALTGPDNGTNLTISAPVGTVITTSALSAAIYNAGATLSVPFTTAGTFGGSNTFSAQLSNASGSFDTPVVIGTGSASPISATIPTTTVAGTSYRIRVVASDPVTLGRDNSTNLTIVNSTVAGLPIVVNKFRNGGGTNGVDDIIELLVVQNNLDVRGMVIKDFSSSWANDNGGKYAFSNAGLWSSLPSGTLIVIRVATTTSSDVIVDKNAMDWNLDVGLDNTTYFTDIAPSFTFDLAGTEILSIRASGAGAAGTAGTLHALANGNPTNTVNFESITGPKLSLTGSTATTTGVAPERRWVVSLNPTQSLADFSGAGATFVSVGGTLTAFTPGAGSNANNTAYINTLRAISTGVEDVRSLRALVSVYPNPVSDRVWVTGDLGRPASGVIALYDLTGRQVGQWRVDRGDGQLNEELGVAQLTAGLYVLRLELPQGTASWKLIKY